MKKSVFALFIINLSVTIGFSQKNALTSEPGSKVVSATDIKWEPLNPARGNQSPRAANLWGDRTSSGASGFLVQFTQGFSSPPHIHNITYRGIVIRGLIHNDDPNAADMWMTTGSYWTQPAGEGHITAAKGSSNMAYIEIENGPYLVQPTGEAFDSGERPVNMEASNVIWVDASNITWIDSQADMPGVQKRPKVAFLWGKPQEGELNGTLIRLPAGFAGEILSNGSDLKVVVIKGLVKSPLNGTYKTMGPGSYFSSKGKAQIDVGSADEAILYVRTNGSYHLTTRK